MTHLRLLFIACLVLLPLSSSAADSNYGDPIQGSYEGAIDSRHQQSFRYYESGYPFEYYMVRFFYHEKREIESRKPE